MVNNIIYKYIIVYWSFMTDGILFYVKMRC